jgi:tRNA-binding EMAP/Myf-like protein
MLQSGSARILKVFCGCIALFLGASLLAGAAVAAMPKPASVTILLTPSLPSPELLGTSVTWTATVQGGQQGHTYDYQFSAALQGQNQVVRDFNLPNSFVWVPWTVEGTYVVTVVVRDITQQPYLVYPPVSEQYVIEPIVSVPGQSAVNPTHHPLVALFSAGPCTVGHSIRVRFHEAGSQASSTSNAVPCSSASANFLVAGMLPDTQYEMHWEEFSSNYFNRGSDLNFMTGSLPSNFPANERMTVTLPPSQHDADFPVVIFHLLPTSGQFFQYWPAATDLSGNIIWYHPGQALLTRMETGGNYFTMSYTTLSEYDLAGNETLESNIEILNEQLAAKGFPAMTGLNNHETRRLPSGDILMLGSHDEISTQYQGGTQQHPVDILGDMVLVLDHNLQLLWAWDTFAHQDLSREATLDDLCYHSSQGCPPFNQNFTTANDWTHANAVQLTSDGNILLSERAQDWLLKINYGSGQGDGHVIWKMGPYGDFTITNPPHQTCGDPNVYPWFTHQHDAAFQARYAFTEVLTVFDDGNLRHQQCNGGNSRGMILSVAEPTRTVYIQLSADLGAYSAALGSAQLLAAPPDPLYASFGNGVLFVPQEASQSTETDLSGNLTYQFQANDWSYRTYRARDLYTPTLP